MNKFAELVKFSEHIGQNHLLAPGASGNISVKMGEVLWIKASGKALSEAGTERIFVPVDQKDAVAAFYDGADLSCLRCDVTGLKPSCETFMHAFLRFPVVVHLHAINTVAWSVLANAWTDLVERLKGIRWAWIPYARSGRKLAAHVMGACSRQRPDVFILANHGLVVGGDTFADVENLIHEVEERLSLPSRHGATPAIENLREQIHIRGWEVAEHGGIHRLGTDLDSFVWANEFALYPCQVLMRNRIGLLRKGSNLSVEIEHHYKQYGCAPAGFLAPARGVVLSSEIKTEEKEQLIFLAEVLSRLDPRSPLRELTEQDVLELADADRARPAITRAAAI